jgi:ubiquinone/menaquinone biosynthesis C-methylase UbiE
MNTKCDTTGSTDILPVRQTKRQTREFYDRIAPIYDLLSERTERYVRQRALGVLNARSGERILEIGPGTGHNLNALAHAVGPRGHVHGIELSEVMLERARRLVLQSGMDKRVTLRSGDAVDLPYADDSMDAVLMTYTLELFDTPEIPVVLSECRRVVRPGGRIVVASLTKEAEEGAVVRALEWTHVHLPQILDCRPIYVRRALAKSGFAIANTAIVHVWVPVEIVLGMVPEELPVPRISPWKENLGLVRHAYVEQTQAEHEQSDCQSSHDPCAVQPIREHGAHLGAKDHADR